MYDVHEACGSVCTGWMLHKIYMIASGSIYSRLVLQNMHDALERSAVDVVVVHTPSSSCLKQWAMAEPV